MIPANIIGMREYFEVLGGSLAGIALLVFFAFFLIAWTFLPFLIWHYGQKICGKLDELKFRREE
jgi:hypothetical protein